MIRQIFLGLLVLAGVWYASPALAKNRYAEGQVWEYRTRASDTGSLLKIQKIGTVKSAGGAEKIYHITVIGLNFQGLPLSDSLGHAPFTRAALDASVIRLSKSNAVFPDATSGIAEWRNAQGGVFTITVAEVVDVLQKTASSQMQPDYINGPVASPET